MGWTACIAESRPVLIIEVVDEHLRALGSSAAQVLGRLAEHGYDLWNMTTGGLRKVALDQPTTANVLATFPGVHDRYINRLMNARFFRNQVT